MDRSFDLVSLMKNHEKKEKHKPIPTQFKSVAGGVQKRLEKNIKYRKSSRLTVFDSVRNLPQCEVPDPISERQKKIDHRRMQLEKWKEEKEKKKKDAATQKKKPFVTGIPHPPLKYVPPPPPKAVPSSSGRVTRSQSKINNQMLQRNNKVSKPLKPSQSFAPSNASFKPELKNIEKIPTLAPIRKNKKKKIDITFDPVGSDVSKKNYLSNSTKSKATSSKLSYMVSKVNTGNKQKEKLEKGRILKNPMHKEMLHSSTSNSDMESWYKEKAFDTKKTSRKLTHSNNKNDSLNPVAKSGSSSEEQLRSPKSSLEKLGSPISSSDGLITPKQMLAEAKKIRKSKILHSSTSNSDMETSLTEKPVNKKKTPRRSSKNKNVTPKKPIPKSESSSEERLRSPNSLSTEKLASPILLSNSPMTPEQISAEAKKISPCVTLSRGKDNARREMKKKMEEGLLDDDVSDIENVDYFRRQLDSEIKRINEMCDTWDKIFQQVPLSESIQELLLGAVGQARLLVSQKLAQFGALVAACARPEPGAALVTPADLQGFWDMVFMQVENVDMRFKKLEDLRARNWIEEQPVIKKKRAPKIVKNNVKPVATSRLRDMIAAARKAKKEKDPSAPVEGSQKEAESGCKTFEAGFFCVRSPVKSPAHVGTPSNKPSLLKAVLSSEAKKASATKNTTSMAMLRASIIGRNVENNEYTGVEQQMTPINLMATPARSILKSTKVTSTKRKSGKKSIKVVLFNELSSETPEKKSEEEDNLTHTTESNEKLGKDNADSGLSSMDVDKESECNKENVKVKSTLIRQNAVDDTSPVLTRSRRKSMSTPLIDLIDNPEDRRRSTRTKEMKEDSEQKTTETPKRRTRRRKSSTVINAM